MSDFNSSGEQISDEAITEEIMYGSQISEKMLIINSEIKSDKFSNSRVRHPEES
jgi:hypothetical protein